MNEIDNIISDLVKDGQIHFSAPSGGNAGFTDIEWTLHNGIVQCGNIDTFLDCHVDLHDPENVKLLEVAYRACLGEPKCPDYCPLWRAEEPEE